MANPNKEALDYQQVLVASYDSVEERLRVDAEVTAVLGTVECVISAASGDNISLASADGSIAVQVTPGGALYTNITNSVTTLQGTSPWITGTVTAQVLNTFSNNEGVPFQSDLFGRLYIAPLNISSDIKIRLQDASGTAIILGQNPMSTSVPVVIASDQTPLPVSQSGTWTTGRTWNLLNTTDSINAVQSGTWNINNISGTISLPTGAATSALQTSGNLSLSSIDTKLTNRTQKTQLTDGTNDNTLRQISDDLVGTDWGIVTNSVIYGLSSSGGGTFVEVKVNPAGKLETNATQSGTWITDRSWTLNSSTDSVNSVQSGIWTVQQGSAPWSQNIIQFGGTNLSTGTGSSGLGIPRVTVSNDSNILATQSGTWTTARSWTLSNSTDSINAVQSGTWNINNISGIISLPTGASTSANQTNGLQQTKITDGINIMAVKAASTAALATDPSSVVALSPNSPLPTGSNNIGSLTNITGTISLPTNASTSALQTTGNTSLASIDSKMNSLGQKTMANSMPIAIASDQTAISVSQSGTWTVQQGTPPWSINGNVASGATDSGNPVKTGAVYNTTLPTVTNGQRVNSQADQNGRLIVTNAPLDGSKATYSASTTGLIVATTPTDIFTFYGSSTKTIRITRISFSGTQNTSATRDILLIKRSSTNSGGTSSSLTAIPHDSSNAAATATALAYTTNPSVLGTAVGSIRSIKMQLLATNVTNPLDRIIWDFGNRPSQSIVLRGTNEGVAINLNSITSSNNSFDINIEWTEES